MTTDKDFKRLVRGRMRKTGESYTAARARLLEKRSPKASTTSRPAPRTTMRRTAAGGSSTATPAPAKQPRATGARRAAGKPAETEYARLAGRSEAAVTKATGCGWERWVKALDHAGAHAWPHTRIARYVHEKYKVPGWWAQGVTTGYERIKGLRAIGQRRGGAYEASKSKTVAVPLARLYAAWDDPRLRARWLPGAALTVRSATVGKWMRITWPDGTSVSVGFMAKGEGKSQVALAHEKLPDEAAKAAMKRYWGDRLEALSTMLTG
jgi:hypothetical protein